MMFLFSFHNTSFSFILSRLYMVEWDMLSLLSDNMADRRLKPLSTDEFEPLKVIISSTRRHIFGYSFLCVVSTFLQIVVDVSFFWKFDKMKCRTLFHYFCTFWTPPFGRMGPIGSLLLVSS